MLTVEATMAILPATPGRIEAITAGAGAGHLRARPAAEEWSANEILAHLRACADVWGGSITRILDEDHPTIRAINPRRWIESTDYADQHFRRSLAAFTAHRQDLLARLEPRLPAAWSRGATMLGAGAPLEVTIHDYAERMAGHERPHITQIQRTLAAVRA
jgi:hypothetical protein